MKRFRDLVAGIVVSATLGACGSQAVPPPPATRADTLAHVSSADRLLQAALHDARVRGSVREVEHVSGRAPATSLTDNVADQAGAQRIVLRSGAAARVLITDDTGYIAADETTLHTYFGFSAAAAHAANDHWVGVPSSATIYASVEDDATLAAVLRDFRLRGHLTELAPSTIRGRKVIGILGTASLPGVDAGNASGTVYVSQSSRPLPVAATFVVSGETARVTLSHWGEHLSLTAPVNAIPLRTLDPAAVADTPRVPQRVSTTPTPKTDRALQHATAISNSAEGYRFTMSMTETISGASGVQIHAAGTYSRPDRSLVITTTVHADGQSLRIPEIVLGDKVYVRAPEAVTAELPAGKSWMMMDLNKVSKGSNLSNLSTLMDRSSETDPAATLGYLKAESPHVDDLGPATVNGLATTHYRAWVDLAKTGAAQPASTRAAARALLKQLSGRILNPTDIPTDVWVDASHRVREMTISMQVLPKGSSRPITTLMKLVISAYGRQPTATPPPASETLDLLALLRAEAKGISLSS